MTLTLMDALNEARRIRMDLTNAQAKLTDIIEALAAHPDSELPRPKCSVCGTTFASVRALAVHTYHSHDGPVPQHYLEAEARAGLVGDADCVMPIDPSLDAFGASLSRALVEDGLVTDELGAARAYPPPKGAE